MDEFTLKKSKFEPYSLWEWNLPEVPLEVFLKTQTEKVSGAEDESHFQWTRFCVNLLLAFENCDKVQDYKKSLEHIGFCEEHLQILTEEECKDSLFTSINSALWHVTLATKIYILYFSKATVRDIKENIKRFELLKPMNPREIAGVLGIKAGVSIQYGCSGHRQALVYAKKARDMDDDQAEWHFLLGNSMARIRRSTNGEISEEEVCTMEKALSLEKNAAYIVHAAQLYQEYSTYLYYNAFKDRAYFYKSRMFATKAIEGYKEALEDCPNSPGMMARVAHGLLRIKLKDLVELTYIKELLDKVVEMNPNNAMVYHDLGLYYAKYQNDHRKAMINLKKAHDLHNTRAFVYLIQLKWKHGLQHEIMSDLKQALGVYPEAEEQEELLAHCGVFSLMMEPDGLDNAIKYFNKALDVNPAGSCLKKYYCVTGKPINILEVVMKEITERRYKTEASLEFAEKCSALLPNPVEQEQPLRNKYSSLQCWKRDQCKVQKQHNYRK